MKRKSIIIQLLNKSIKFINNNKIIEYELNSVFDSKISNKNKFLDSMKEIISKEKINNRLLTDDVKIIIDNNYTDLELEILKEVFKELSFHKISFIKLNSILQKNDNEVLIQIDNNNIKIYLFDKIYETKIHFNEEYEVLKLYLEKITKKYKITRVKLFGTYPKIDSLLKLEEDLKIPVYIFSHPYDIPLTLLI